MTYRFIWLESKVDTKFSVFSVRNECRSDYYIHFRRPKEPNQTSSDYCITKVFRRGKIFKNDMIYIT